MKKIFVISSILLVVVLIFLGIYRFAFKDTGSTVAVPSPQKERTPQRQPALADAPRKTADKKSPKDTDRIIPVSRAAVVSPIVDKTKGVVRYYRKDTGQVMEVPLLGGSARMFSAKRLPGFVYAAWAPDTQRVLTKFVDDRGVRIYLFDHRTQRGKQLKRGIERVDWTANGDKILYTFFDGATRRTTLNIADPDGTNWRVLARDVPRGTRFTSIKQSSRIAFWRAPNPYEKTALKVVSLLDADPKPTTIFAGHYNADYLFSPNGERILISSTQQRGSNARVLGVANADGGEYHNLHIPTNVRKCVWSSDNNIIYCAFPTGDRDTFWKIDVTSNKKERILDLDKVVSSSTRYRAFDLFLDPDETALFFVNAIDGKLYRIAL